MLHFKRLITAVRTNYLELRQLRDGLTYYRFGFFSPNLLTARKVEKAMADYIYPTSFVFVCSFVFNMMKKR